MKCQLLANYKGVKEVKAGSFKNSNGDVITYLGSYKLIFDQYINNIPKECELKISKELALNISQNLKVYDQIVITLDVVIYGNNNVSVKVISIENK